jgi:suppressor of ftsI
MIYSTLLVALLIIFPITPATSTCSTSSPSTILNNCPLPVKTLTPTSPNLDIELTAHTLTLPNNVVLHGYAYRFGGGNSTTRIPAGIIKFAKGVQATVNFTNSAPTMSNLHTHGLHISGETISPGVSSDDVSVEVPGNGGQWTYKYNIPSDHAGGTHWFHAHVHMYTEAHVTGGAFGMIIVDDDPDGKEIPKDVLNMPTYMLVLSHLNRVRTTQAQNAWATITPANTPNQYLVNGFSGSTSILRINQNEWTRLRILHVNPADALYVTIPYAAGCTVLLLAKDGVYIPGGPRYVNALEFTTASRVDLLVRCYIEGNFPISTDNSKIVIPAPPGGGPAPATPPDVTLFTLSVIANSSITTPKGDFINFTPCLPAYLQDTTGLTNAQVVSTSFNIQVRITPPPASLHQINGQSFSGFGIANSIHNMTAGTVEQFNLDTVGHPLHIHVQPYQLQNDFSNWHRKGDWVDTFLGAGGPQTPAVPVRSRIDQHTGKVVLHCHILAHEDLGLMAVSDNILSIICVNLLFCIC